MRYHCLHHPTLALRDCDPLSRHDIIADCDMQAFVLDSMYDSDTNQHDSLLAVVHDVRVPSPCAACADCGWLDDPLGECAPQMAVDLSSWGTSWALQSELRELRWDTKRFHTHMMHFRQNGDVG